MKVDSNTPGYPLRTTANLNAWACLRPVALNLAKGHPSSGKVSSLVLHPHFGGRSRKEKVISEPYSINNPCKVKTSGQGASYWGFYQRPDHLRRKHRSAYRGPRRAIVFTDVPRT